MATIKVSELTEAEVRKLRNAEPYELIDSVRIGPGMNAVSRGWYNSWADFANRDQVTFFQGRDPGALGPWVNQETERRDYAIFIYHAGVEFHAPITARAWAQEPSDAAAMPGLFVGELPQNFRMQMEVSGTDIVLDMPAVDMPPGTGSTNGTSNDNAIAYFQAGNVGSAFRSNMWHFPDPLGIPANAQFKLWGKLDPVIRQFYQNFENCPGTRLMPGCADPGDDVALPCIYSIRVRLVVKRLVQLRGARTAA